MCGSTLDLLDHPGVLTGLFAEFRRDRVVRGDGNRDGERGGDE
jgi:hypothetical protein